MICAAFGALVFHLRMLLVLVQVYACMCVHLCTRLVQIRKGGSLEEVKGCELCFTMQLRSVSLR